MVLLLAVVVLLLGHNLLQSGGGAVILQGRVGQIGAGMAGRRRCGRQSGGIHAGAEPPPVAALYLGQGIVIVSIGCLFHRLDVATES